MVRPFFSALAIILLFPRLCEGYLPLCPGGNLHKEAIEEKILKPVNHRRQGLIEGWQQNGKTGKNLPPATDMTKLRRIPDVSDARSIWSKNIIASIGAIRFPVAKPRRCSKNRISKRKALQGNHRLDRTAVVNVDVQQHHIKNGISCFRWHLAFRRSQLNLSDGPPHDDTIGRTLISYAERSWCATEDGSLASIHKFYYPSGDILGNVIQSYLLQINLHHLDVDADAHNVYYNGDEQLKTYANLVRSTNTEIGCAIKGCDNPANDPDLGEVVMCCVLNSRGVKWQCIHIERSIDRVMLGLTHLTHVRARIRRSILHQQSKIRDAAVYAIMSRIG
ncbi:hypothetical protein Y032_0004g1768 [Ancylostoma ceylanicum]|uniref:SCP domain-containing protein n=1 Tax=Ancylostoma ceylanicum TaxID=53326 RepID=A0A016VVI9_9BILA|nr:hypothetical protein Y032_0004g1768 [Ancylostoma ceylanicum]